MAQLKTLAMAMGMGMMAASSFAIVPTSCGAEMRRMDTGRILMLGDVQVVGAVEVLAVDDEGLILQKMSVQYDSPGPQAAPADGELIPQPQTGRFIALADFPMHSRQHFNAVVVNKAGNTLCVAAMYAPKFLGSTARSPIDTLSRLQPGMVLDSFRKSDPADVTVDVH